MMSALMTLRNWFLLLLCFFSWISYRQDNDKKEVYASRSRLYFMDKNNLFEIRHCKLSLLFSRSICLNAAYIVLLA